MKPNSRWDLIRVKYNALNKIIILKSNVFLLINSNILNTFLTIEITCNENDELHSIIIPGFWKK